MKRELNEELGMTVYIQGYVEANLHEYPSQPFKLIAYNCIFIEATWNLIDLDKGKWMAPSELNNYQMAPADIPFINIIIENIKTSKQSN